MISTGFILFGIWISFIHKKTVNTLKVLSNQLFYFGKSGLLSGEPIVIPTCEL